MGTWAARARPLPRRVVAGAGSYVRAHARLAGLAAGIVLVIGAAVAVYAWPRGGAGADAPPRVPVAWQRASTTRDGLVDASGIRLVRVSVSGDGGLLDLRYQVVDPNRAAAVHDAATPPAIVDEKSGLVLNSLLMGHAHEGELKAAVTYYLIFENTGGWVHRGSSVTVLLGDVQVEHVVVE
jgi:hypothetical protein